jgi:hypothetical protein
MAARDGAGAAGRGGRKPRHAAGGDRAELLISTAAVALMAAAFSIPAMALGPKASGGNFSPQSPPSHYQIPSDYGIRGSALVGKVRRRWHARSIPSHHPEVNYLPSGPGRSARP